MTIKVSKEIQAQMTSQAESAYPVEACGFIVGERSAEDAVGHYYHACENRHDENRTRRFLIDPEDYLETENRAEGEGLSIISIVHSHPDHPDRPSEFDRQHAWPGISYIIISVVKGKATSYRSWWLMDTREKFTEEPIVD